MAWTIFSARFQYHTKVGKSRAVLMVREPVAINNSNVLVSM